jgi:hypothetical protein
MMGMIKSAVEQFQALEMMQGKYILNRTLK